MNQFNRERLWSDFRVGVITFIGLTFLFIGITFAGGDKGLLFKKVTLVKAQLGDVGGLKKGASVTMNGMVIGKVTDISFTDGQDGKEAAQTNPGVANQIEVTMEIRTDIRKRIKADSVPAVRTQGMLGDRYIDIPPGSPEAEVLPEGKILQGASASDFDKTLNQTIDVLNETEKLLRAINQQQGTAGKLLYDQKFYDQLTSISDELDSLIKDFKKNPRRYIKFSVF